MSMTRRRLLQSAGGLSVALAGCTGGGSDGDGTDGGAQSSDGSGASVSMVDTSFQPPRTSIETGATVEWTNEDGFAHDVTAAQFHDAAADWDFAVDVGAGESTSHTFDEAGVYEYTCTIHGKSTMCGVVLVGDASLDATLPCAATGAGGGGYSVGDR